MKKLMIRIMMLVSVMFLVYSTCGQVQAVENTNTIEEQLEYYASNIDVDNITKEDILNIYDQISEQYSPEYIADMLEENTKKIEEQGISQEVVEAGANFIRNTDTKSIRNIIEDEIDIEDIKEKIEKGYTADQILDSIVQETPNEKKIEIATRLVWSNKIIQTVVMVMVALFIYGTVLRWIIYVKAGKPGWAAIIPVYRQVVMYQVCGLSPWLMLLWFIPILGWIAMFVVAIMKRFCLAKEFGRGALFGFGLLFLSLIFQSILAFHPNIQKIEKEA